MGDKQKNKKHVYFILTYKKTHAIVAFANKVHVYLI